jgi:transcriptional regulator with XRE-family HTH domain
MNQLKIPTELEMKKIFSNRLKTIMDKEGMNQRELADKLHLSESTIGKWILMKSMPRMGKIQQIADLFHVGKSYFLEESSAPASLPPLNQNDEREIARDLEDMMHSMASAAYDGEGELEDVEAFKATLKAAMIQAKRIAKKKYTPKKYQRG